MSSLIWHQMGEQQVDSFDWPGVQETLQFGTRNKQTILKNMTFLLEK